MKKNQSTQETNTIKPQYIFDRTGSKTAVILDIQTFENLLEAVEDSYLSALGEEILKTETEFIDLDEIKDELLTED